MTVTQLKNKKKFMAQKLIKTYIAIFIAILMLAACAHSPSATAFNKTTSVIVDKKPLANVADGNYGDAKIKSSGSARTVEITTPKVEIFGLLGIIGVVAIVFGIGAWIAKLISPTTGVLTIGGGLAIDLIAIYPFVSAAIVFSTIGIGCIIHYWAKIKAFFKKLFPAKPVIAASVISSTPPSA